MANGDVQDPISAGIDRLFSTTVEATPLPAPIPSPGLQNIDTAETQALDLATQAATAPITRPGPSVEEPDDSEFQNIKKRISLKAMALRVGISMQDREQALTEYESLSRLKLARAGQEIQNLSASVRGLVTGGQLQRREGIFAANMARKMQEIKDDNELDNMKLDMLGKFGREEIDLDTAMQGIANKRIQLLGTSQTLANNLEFMKIAYGTNNIAQANAIFNQVLGVVQTGLSLTTSIVALT